MSDEILREILSKLETMNRKIDSQGDMVTQLIKMVSSTNAKLDELSQKFR